ncbi:serine hydrolase domain-containing protein [Chryseolinea sp. T2]|uniref:serine hydrolase domain-containing protein n=1 Tax=Chryseolinea sp. T2 TaxID=3129255 RepID=UPI0030774891
MYRRSSLFIALFSILFASTFGQQPALEGAFQSLIEEQEIIGLAVVAVKDGRIVYKHNFGMQNREQNIPLNERSIFRIASISKSFSAVTIMQLMEDGKVSLDDDFSKLVGFTVRNPNYPDKIITLRMIMSHTSSVNDSQGYTNLDFINPAKNPNYAKCYSSFAPGEKYDYCNLNYNMVGAVIERLTGERFDMRIKNHILKPLGLYGGYCVDSLDASRFTVLYACDSATGKYIPSTDAYAPRREQLATYQLGYSTPVLSPTGGMKISAEDLCKYMMMHMNNGTSNGIKIMSSKHAQLMRTKITDDESYGLAMRESSDLIPGEVLKGHTGTAYGLYSAMFFEPKKKFGFVVIVSGCRPQEEIDIKLVLRKSMKILYDHIIK